MSDGTIRVNVISREVQLTAWVVVCSQCGFVYTNHNYNDALDMRVIRHENAHRKGEVMTWASR